MTREEAKEELDFCELVVSENIVCGTYEGYPCCVIDDLLKKIFDEHEAQLQAKEEELNELLNFNSNLLYELGKRPNEKARSIVAMLFWEMKRSKEKFKKADAYFDDYEHGIYDLSKLVFLKSYAMLKATT